VVVGAGLAGLACADRLADAGWDVLVAEARERVGGRVHTLRFAGGQVAEAGGEYIDGSHTTMRGLARRFGLALDDLQGLPDAGSGCVYLRGRRRLQEAVYSRAINAQIARFEDAITRLGDPLNPDDPVADGAALDRISIGGFLDRLGIHGLSRQLITHGIIRDDYTVEPERLSLLFVAQASAAPGFQEERYRVRGGNDQIPGALAAKLGDRVLLSAPVTAVVQDAGGVTVTAGGRALSADVCVLAAPLPALRAISFAPSLPAPWAAAIASLQYGTGAKVAMQFSSRVWRSQGFDGETLTDLPVYIMGAPGQAFARLSDAARIRAAVADVQRIYPGTGPRLTAAQTVCWNDEPYTGGTYSAYAPGQVTRFWRALRTPQGRLLMAGEHTDTLTAYMEGAARSGLRAATALINQRGRAAV